VSAFVRENATTLVLASIIVVFGIVAGLAVSAIIRPGRDAAGVASPSPVAAMTAPPAASPQPRSATPGPSATPSPTPLMSPSPTSTGPPSTPGSIDIASPIPTVSIDGADPEVAAAIEEAIAAIDALDAYRTEVELIGRDLFDVRRDSHLDMGMRATVDRDPVQAFDALVGFRMVESDDSAAISSGYRVVRIDDEEWSVEQDKVEAVDPANSSAQTVMLLLPDETAARMILPFAGGYERIGADQRADVATTHYGLTEAGKEAYAAVTGLPGEWTGDLWIAADGGYLVEARLTARRPDPEAPGRDISYSVVVTDADEPGIEVKPPT
jgi:hypothetical protein